MLGFVLMCITAANDGMVGVLARRMSTLHFSVMMFWFAALGFTFTSLTILTKMFLSGQIPSILTYSLSQYRILTITGICSSLNLTCLTIAFQSDKSTTVSLLAYIELVYAFAADILLYDSTFTMMEVVGAAIITFFNVLTIVERGRVEEERRSQMPRNKEYKPIV